MALRAVFIGINKHSDPGIPELTGATNDATALWALFKDDEATAASIRRVLDTSLGDAAEDDTVIVFFAGHGTPGHQLVPFDTDLSAVDQTTIPMQELVNRLKATSSRASLIILDCCFSGSAPARVLDGLPVARSGVPTVTDLGGDGCVVLAAARDDQAALELGQHGLFTAAMLRVIQDGPGWTDIGVLMEEVTRQVRAEASRTGHDQTPVWAGLLKGGIELPPLQPGSIFAAEFPDTTGIRVGTAIAELSAFCVPEPVLGEWRTRFSELNNLQLAAVNDYRVLDGHPLLVVAPTTSGKTFVGELAAARAIADGRKAVFLLPFKALANEKYDEFEQLYGQGLGLRVLRCTGDYSDQTGPFVKGRYDVALLTYEMFLGLSVAMPTLLYKIGLVVLDEAQFITDPTRGIGVELLLTNLLAARERGADPQIVALSAVIGNVNHFDDWLGCQTLETNHRPVPLVEGVLDRSGTYQYLDGQRAGAHCPVPPAARHRPEKGPARLSGRHRASCPKARRRRRASHRFPQHERVNLRLRELFGGRPWSASSDGSAGSASQSGSLDGLRSAPARVAGWNRVPHERPVPRRARDRRTRIPRSQGADPGLGRHVYSCRRRQHAGRDRGHR